MARQMRFEQRMSESDALMWRNEKDPMLRTTVIATAVLDTTPDRQRLLDRLERASRQIPRLRQRVVHSPLSAAPPRWEVDPHFDLRYHVRWCRAAGGGDVTELFRLAEPMAMQGFDRARPLWELLVVEGLADGQAGTALKLHHSISDGVGLVQLAMSLFDLERDPTEDPGPLPPAPEPEDLGVVARIA
ncbi:MAG TPA: wax ester/triacylglycerol synthase domain-containing protein, partial [Acidimicrobiales bacterium]|nr:wax ester/triacylglycerol synthase domain-containing protein [Acidimicrobiales bacterium]